MFRVRTTDVLLRPPRRTPTTPHPRLQALIDALATDARLVVAQFAALNAAGHKHGADYGTGSEYAAAIAAKAALLERVVATLNDQHAQRPTTLLLTSDHGMLERGGTGSVSAAEREVPLLSYRFGSQHTREAGGCGDEAHTTLDVPTTVAALLQVPVPRHSQGTVASGHFDRADASTAGAEDSPSGFNIKAWQWRDLYYQRRAFVTEYLEHPEAAPAVVTCAAGPASSHQLAPLSEFVAHR